MTIQDLKNNGLILFECISGSNAYGTNKITSDIDYRGVFILPKDDIFGFEYLSQVGDDTNDIIFYEIKRFLELLEVNNPNILEILNMPSENIIYKHPLFDLILEQKEKFLTKNCKNTFGGYAGTQIKKARGLNKKIVNPVDKVKKTILDFCFVIDGYGTIPLREFMAINGYLRQGQFGIVNVPNAKDTYALFYDEKSLGYRGIMNEDETSNEVRLSSIPKGETSVGVMLYNKDGYTKYCNDYKSYWDWVENRNNDRYETNAQHGKNYDSKNMMHCIRLLRMAREIGLTGEIIVKRPDVSDLMEIRNGVREYDDLLNEANTIISELNNIFDSSTLPDTVNHNFVNDLLIKIRTEFYNKKENMYTYRKPENVEEALNLYLLYDKSTTREDFDLTSLEDDFKDAYPSVFVYNKKNKLIGIANIENGEVIGVNMNGNNMKLSKERKIEIRLALNS